MLSNLANYIPARSEIHGYYVEPFVGSGAVFLFVRPRKAILADVNPELIDLYRTICGDPQGVWQTFAALPEGKEAYNNVRKLKPQELDPLMKAARLLYLNRTCFKGMWRHNLKGDFNVGYGGPSRRWVITQKDLVTVAKMLRDVELRCVDFEDVIDNCSAGDFVFVDPPYKPGHREQTNAHYVGQTFTFADHERLASTLRDADSRGVLWTITNSAHPDLLRLYQDFSVVTLPVGTGTRPGVLTNNSGEVIISNKC